MQFSKAKDLEEWAEAPEEFHLQAGAGAWSDGTFSLRTSTEILFATVLEVMHPLIHPIHSRGKRCCMCTIPLLNRSR